MTASNDFFEVVRTTRSVRRRLDFDKRIDPEVIERCIDGAVQAPTGLDQEAWRFLVLTDPEPKRRVADLYQASFDALSRRLQSDARPEFEGVRPPSDRSTYVELARNLHRMPALILVCSEGRPDPSQMAMQVAFYASVLPAAWSLMLSLRAEGLGTTWTTLLVAEEEKVAESLGIPPGVTQTVLLPVAYTLGAKLRPAARKAAAEVTYWNRWGYPRE